MSTRSQRFKLSEHPWVSLIVLLIIMVSTLLACSTIVQRMEVAGYEISPVIETASGMVVGALLFFGVVPYVFGLPHERTSLERYFSAIGLQRPKSITRLAVVTVPCIAILFSSWLLASFVYASLRGWDLAVFATQMMDVSRALPPCNWSIITSIGSIWEEVLLRGIFLTILLERHTERESIGLSALAFGGIHILNLMNGPPTAELLIGVLAQILWAAMYGLFYGYLFVKTRSLIPCMVLHYVGNGYISFWWYTPFASFMQYTALMLMFYIGVLPTISSLLWVRYATRLGAPS